jgi:hypothetical protein
VEGADGEDAVDGSTPAGAVDVFAKDAKGNASSIALKEVLDGFDLVGGRGDEGGALMIGLGVALDDIVGTAIQGYPNLANQSLDTLVAVHSGGLYLVGSLSRRDTSRLEGGGLSSRATGASEGQALQLWANAYRVNSDARVCR